MTDTHERWHYHAPLPQGAIDAGQVILRDGSTAELRPVIPEDKELVAAFLKRTSAEARRHRFFGDTPLTGATEHLIKHGPPEKRMALVVLTQGESGPRIIAHGEYTRDSDDLAEVAFLVDDQHQGKGLGTLLLERLALIAVRHGIRRFHGPTEAGNMKMRDVFRQSGFPVTEERSSGEVEVSFSIEPSEDSVGRAETRERIATVASLQAFMKPRSVALIGASRDPGSIGRRMLHNLVLGGFTGPVYPVNLEADVVGSMPAYASVRDVPGPVDLAVIAVPWDAVPDVISECGEEGVRGLVIISAGFAETGAEGRELQTQLVQKARGYGMRLLGPNCLGLINTAPDVRLNASLTPAIPPQGPVAMASQSGALGLAALDYARELGTGLSSFVSLGNKADISSNDLIQYWEDDPDTRVILLYLESFGNPRRFARLARRVGRSKPIIAVKAGRSAAGRRAASTHTAALAAGEQATRALFQQTGVIRAETLEEMFDITALLARQPLPKGPRIAVVTNAGGPAILAVDALEAAGLETPETPPSLNARLDELVPDAPNTSNPIDLSASATATDYQNALSAVLADAAYDITLAIFSPIGFEDTGEVTRAIHNAVAAARRQGNDKPVLTCIMGRTHATPDQQAESHRIPTYRSPEAAARALGKAWRYEQWRRQPLGRVPDFDDLDIAQARDITRDAQARGGGPLTADETQAMLSAFGLPMTDAHQAGHSEDGVELTIGVTQDPLFGPLVAFGLGGTYADVLQDVVFRITPLTDRDAREMIRGIRAHELLTGRNGQPPADTAALEDLLLRVSRLIEEVPDITELDLNPVRALRAGKGCHITGARIEVRG